MTTSTYGTYQSAADDVAKTIFDRDGTHGDPIAFALCYAGLVNAFLRPIVAAGRLVSPADALVLLDLMKTARIAVGGAHPDHFRDKAGYAVIGLAHVSAVFAQGAAMEAAAAPQAPEDAPAALDPLRGANPDMLDEAYYPNIALHRDILDEGADVWADLLHPPAPGASAKERLYKAGVTQPMVQARFNRVFAFLDVGANRPRHTLPSEWEAAKRRVLPLVYADA